MATLEVPLADPVGSPKRVSADYYYKIPVRPIYKSYPIYAPGHEPQGYMEWLKQQEPVVIWDDAGHRPSLQTEAGWIKAGEIVFGAPISYDFPAGVMQVRDPAWYQKTRTPAARDGTMPFNRYVVREKGHVEVGSQACGVCHTRVMPNGSVISGAKGNNPGHLQFAAFARLGMPVAQLHMLTRSLLAVPWLYPDPHEQLYDMPVDAIASLFEVIPPGVQPRERTSLFWPVQVPDLTGVKDRHYLDRTGLQQHRSIVDLMRYAALNQGGDSLASFDGFIPAGFPDFKKRPDPSTRTRYSDEQLYALALYLYSLKPPPNPNKFDAVAAHGQKVFEAQGCAMCHTPALYTNNKLTPAEGFAPPEEDLKKYDILPIGVGTDPNLTLKTRRGTGYYKVPSIKGVWYRGMFGHSGWCATLEDWFDPRRVRDDYRAVRLEAGGDLGGERPSLRAGPEHRRQEGPDRVSEDLVAQGPLLSLRLVQGSALFRTVKDARKMPTESRGIEPSATRKEEALVLRTIRRLLILSLTQASWLSAQERPAAFVDVAVVPMDTERILPHQTVVVMGGRIAQVGPSSSAKVPRGAMKIDGRGKFLMPGLADMHVHFMRPAAAGQFMPSASNDYAQEN